MDSRAGGHCHAKYAGNDGRRKSQRCGVHISWTGTVIDKPKPVTKPVVVPVVSLTKPSKPWSKGKPK